MSEHKGILKQVRENLAKLRSCKKHKFCREAFGDYKVRKVTCLNCGGTMDKFAIYKYIEGYEAAGGNANDIVEDWQKGGE